MKIQNAIIIAAGSSSRFAPLSYEKHKALTVVKGDVLIERMIRQLQSVGIQEIYVVTGYKAEQFTYLAAQFGIRLISNPEYQTRNNNSSIWAVRHVLGNSLILASDLYFKVNPFLPDAEDSWYGAEYAKGVTREWCMHEDENGWIDRVTVGGKNAWYMTDHAFWSEDFSKKFLYILENTYADCAEKLWETIFMEHLNELKMKVRKYSPGTVYEFDSLDSLRSFDESYKSDTRSTILKKIAAELSITEDKITDVCPVMDVGTEAMGFTFQCVGKRYQYLYKAGEIKEKG